MALVVVNGNIWDSGCEVIAHQCNCFNTMGAGFAKQVAQRYPRVLEADRQYYAHLPQDKLGRCSHALVDNNSRFIFNLYGQFYYGSTRQRVFGESDALERATRLMLSELKQLGNTMFKKIRIGVPHGIGAGLAGGDWNEISAMLGRVSDEYGIHIYAYKL